MVRVLASGGRRRLPGQRRFRPGPILATLQRAGEVLETVVDPETAAWIALVVLTAGEGLAFNRAFLLLAETGQMKGFFGVGPRTVEEAHHVWADIRRRGVRPLERLQEPDPAVVTEERRRHAETLARLTHPIGTGCTAWRRAFVGRPNHPNPCVRHWAGTLGSQALVVIPLMTPEQPWGVILADNFVTRAPIYPGMLQAAETLAHGLRAALERSQLMQTLQEEQRRRLASEHATTLVETARTLAHDLKNPLALAGGLARELAAAPPAAEETLRRQLSVIADAAAHAEDRLTQLVAGLASRAGNAAEAGELEAIDVGALAAAVVEAFSPLAAARRSRLLFYRPCHPVIARATPALVERCIENLLGNATEALAANGGEILVAVSDHGEWVRLDVSDNGPPLPAVIRSHPFDGGLTTRVEGSGIGLLSVRKLAEAMGGRVEYDETEPGWVRFSLLLRRWV